MRINLGLQRLDLRVLLFQLQAVHTVDQAVDGIHHPSHVLIEFRNLIMPVQPDFRFSFAPVKIGGIAHQQLQPVRQRFGEQQQEAYSPHNAEQAQHDTQPY